MSLGPCKPGGVVNTYAVSGTTKTPKKPVKTSAKPSMVMGPFGGKSPA
jgi:hypothetical protein